MMRTHGHVGGEHHTLGSVGGSQGRGSGGGWGGQGGITWREMPDVGDRKWRQQTTLPCVYLSYIICRCTPEPKLQLKKKRQITVLATTLPTRDKSSGGKDKGFSSHSVLKVTLAQSCIT